jgi:toxin HigB-1
LIRGWKNAGLKRLYERGDASKVPAEHRRRIEDVLAHLDLAVKPKDLDLPGYRLHALKGDLAGFWSVTITRNRRIIFRMEDGDAVDVNFLDYH